MCSFYLVSQKLRMSGKYCKSRIQNQNYNFWDSKIMKCKKNWRVHFKKVLVISGVGGGAAYLSSCGISAPRGLIQRSCLTSSMLGTWARQVSTRFFPARISWRPLGRILRCGSADLLWVPRHTDTIHSVTNKR